MSDIIDFTPPYVPVIVIGVSLILLFVVIDFVSYRLMKRKQKALKTWVAVTIAVTQSLLIAGGAFLLGPAVNESMNQQAVQAALTEGEVSVNDEQFQRLRAGEVITVDGTYIALTPVDDAGLKFELNVAPVSTDEEERSVEEILTPEQ